MKQPWELEPQALPPLVRLTGLLRNKTTELSAHASDLAAVPEARHVPYVAINPEMEPIPLRLAGATAIKPQEFLNEPFTGLTLMGFYMFSGDKPYIFGHDYGAYGSAQKYYHLVCNVKSMPFVVNDHRVQTAGLTSIATGIDKYLRDVEEFKQPGPYYLNDAEAFDLIEALSSPQLLDEVNVDEVKNWYGN